MLKSYRTKPYKFPMHCSKCVSFWETLDSLSIPHFPTDIKSWQRHCYYYYTRLTALSPGLPRSAGTRKVKPIWILLKQETVSGSGISCTWLQTVGHNFFAASILTIGKHRRRKGSVVGGGHHGECGASAYNGGLGAEPPVGSRGRAPGQRVRGAKLPSSPLVRVVLVHCLSAGLSSTVG